MNKAAAEREDANVSTCQMEKPPSSAVKKGICGDRDDDETTRDSCDSDCTQVKAAGKESLNSPKKRRNDSVTDSDDDDISNQNQDEDRTEDELDREQERDPTAEREEVPDGREDQYVNITLVLPAALPINMHEMGDLAEILQMAMANALPAAAHTTDNIPTIRMSFQATDNQGHDASDFEASSSTGSRKKRRPQHNSVETDETIPSQSLLPVGLKYVMLEELLLSYQNAQNEPVDLPHLEGSGADFTKADYQNMMYFRLVQVVNRNRSLSSLKNLPMGDQLALVKEQSAKINLIHLSIKHNMETGMTYLGYPGTQYISVDSAKYLKGNYYEETTKIKRTFPDRYRSNESVYVILCALALFESTSPNVVNKAAVQYEQRIYQQLLKEYLESTYGKVEGRSMHKYLTGWMNHVFSWSEQNAPRTRFDIEPYTFYVSNVSVDDFFE